MRAALYARVSTVDQEPENQLAEYDAIARPEDGRRRSSSIAACPDRRIAGQRLTN